MGIPIASRKVVVSGPPLCANSGYCPTAWPIAGWCLRRSDQLHRPRWLASHEAIHALTLPLDHSLRADHRSVRAIGRSISCQ